MVTKKRVMKEEVKEETVEELRCKLELAVRALMCVRDAMGHMGFLYDELLKAHKKALKHIAKLEKKLEK
jgi:hypothetical protein